PASRRASRLRAARRAVPARGHRARAGLRHTDLHAAVDRGRLPQAGDGAARDGRRAPRRLLGAVVVSRARFAAACALAALGAVACSVEQAPRTAGVYLLLDTSGTYRQELVKAK